MAIARTSVTEILLDSLVGSADSLITYTCTLATVQTVQQSRRAASPVDVDRQQFCFQATRPKQVDIPFFKVQD